MRARAQVLSARRPARQGARLAAACAVLVYAGCGAWSERPPGSAAWEPPVADSAGTGDSPQDTGPEAPDTGVPFPCDEGAGTTIRQPAQRSYLVTEPRIPWFPAGAVVSTEAEANLLVMYGGQWPGDVEPGEPFWSVLFGYDATTGERRFEAHSKRLEWERPDEIHVDGDGIATLLTGIDYNVNTGEARLVSRYAHDGAVVGTLTGPDDRRGSTAWFADYLAVGYPDWQAGAHLGAIVVYPGPLVGEMGIESAAFLHVTLWEGGELGYFTNVGDADGDGIDDVTLIVNQNYFVTGTDLLVDGGVGNGLSVHVDGGGGNVVAAGDLSGDGLADWTSIDIDIYGHGTLSVVEGPSLVMSARIRDLDPDRLDYMLLNLGSVGDLDGNGHDTIVVAAENPYPESHEVFLLDGPLCGVVDVRRDGWRFVDGVGAPGIFPAAVADHSMLLAGDAEAFMLHW